MCAHIHAGGQTAERPPPILSPTGVRFIKGKAFYVQGGNDQVQSMKPVRDVGTPFTRTVKTHWLYYLGWCYY